MESLNYAPSNLNIIFMGKSKYYYPIEELRLNAKTDKFN
jgi:hypothetical protein